MRWKSINELLKSNDVVFFGDIKSRNLVKDTHIVFVEEHYTTKTRSFCGKLNNPKASKLYSCGFCKKHVGRDENAAKNIFIKGIIEWENLILRSSASKDDIYETV